MKITGSNVTLMIHDMDRSINFYQSLGLSLTNRWDNNYAMVSGEGITIGLHPAAGMVLTSGSVSLGFFIEDLDAARDLLQRHSILFDEKEDTSGHYLYFKDPDGTHLYFVKPAWD